MRPTKPPPVLPALQQKSQSSAVRQRPFGRINRVETTKALLSPKAAEITVPASTE